jgi:hypothetical protein
MALHMRSTAAGVDAIASSGAPASQLHQPEPGTAPSAPASQQQAKRPKPSRKKKHASGKASRAANARVRRELPFFEDEDDKEPLQPLEDVPAEPVASQPPQQQQQREAPAGGVMAPPSRAPKRRAEPGAQAWNEGGTQVRGPGAAGVLQGCLLARPAAAEAGRRAEASCRAASQGPLPVCGEPVARACRPPPLPRACSRRSSRSRSRRRWPSPRSLPTWTRPRPSTSSRPSTARPQSPPPSAHAPSRSRPAGAAAICCRMRWMMHLQAGGPPRRLPAAGRAACVGRKLAAARGDSCGDAAPAIGPLQVQPEVEAPAQRLPAGAARRPKSRFSAMSQAMQASQQERGAAEVCGCTHLLLGGGACRAAEGRGCLPDQQWR